MVEIVLVMKTPTVWLKRVTVMFFQIRGLVTTNIAENCPLVCFKISALVFKNYSYKKSQWSLKGTGLFGVRLRWWCESQLAYL